MKILAVDTAEWKISLALWEDGKELSFREHLHPKDQAALLPQFVEDILQDHRVDLFLVNIGPGSFTGIRIGLGFMKGLSLGSGIPLKGMDKFTALYHSLNSPKNALLLIEAQRQDIYGQLFEKGRAHAPKSFTREEIFQILDSPSPPLIGGSGFDDFLSPLSYERIDSLWTGAQSLAYTFFNCPALTVPPIPFYVRSADITLPSSAKSSEKRIKT